MIRIVECTPGHVGIMSRRMRAADRREVIALYGPDVRKAIRRCYHMSSVRRSAFIGNDLAAIWGLTGTVLNDEVYGWLLTTPTIEKAPIAFYREAKRQLKEFLETKNAIRGHVEASYFKAIEFMKLLGFSASVPRPMGEGGAMFRELVIRKGWI